MYNDEYDDQEQEVENGNFLKNFYYNNKILIWIFIGIIVFILLMSLLTRGGSNSNNNTTETNYEVKILPDNDVTISIGNSTKLIAQVSGNNNATIIWSSDNENIAKVDNGTVTAINYGTTNITATFTDSNNKKYSASKKVDVADGNPNLVLTDVSFKNGDLLMPLNSTYNISLTLTPSNGYITNKEFTSSNENVVTVDNNGVVRSVGEGEATISVNVNNNFRKELKVYVNRDYTATEIIVSPETIKFDSELKKMKVGSSEKLSYTVFPNDADKTRLTWSSSDTSVVTVDDNGIVKALKEGRAVITLQSITGVNNTIDIEVESNFVDVTDVTLPLSSLSLTVGQSQTITPTVSPDNASNKSLNYISSDTSVVNVAINETGTSATLIGLRVGTASVTVTSGNIKKSISVVVIADNSSEGGDNNGGNGNNGGNSSSSQGFSISSSDANGGKFVVSQYSKAKPANNGAVGPVTITLTITSSSVAKLRAAVCAYSSISSCNPSNSGAHEIVGTGSFTISGVGEWVIRVGEYDSNDNLKRTTDKFIWIKSSNGSSSSSCTAGKYLSGSSCVSCPSGYTSAAGSTLQTQCYITVAAGKGATFTGNTHQIYTCASGYYASSSRKVYYGQSSGCTKCSGTVNDAKTTCSTESKKTPTVNVNITKQNDTTMLANISADVKGKVQNSVSGSGMSIPSNHQSFDISNIHPYQYGVQIKCTKSGVTGTLTVQFTPSDSSYESKTVTKSFTCPTTTTKKYTCSTLRTNIQTCSYTKYTSKSVMETTLNNGSSTASTVYGCVSKSKTYCGSTATSCYDSYSCTLS